jgi:sporadic carbohydrate cluster protein (TIGR04323 family)
MDVDRTITRQNLITYSFSRSFFGMNIPIPIQSAYLREYSARNGLNFCLPVTEVCFGNSYYSLGNVFRNMSPGDNFGAVSILVLPLHDTSLYADLMGLLDRKQVTLHFPLEGFIGSKESLTEWCENFMLMRRLARVTTGCYKGFIEDDSK